MDGLAMIVTPLTGPMAGLSTEPPAPDVALPGIAAPAAAGGDFARAVAGALDGARTQLERAGEAETSFVSGRGTLQAMVLERAQADVALSLATAAASRVTQSLSTILGMQV